MTIALLGGVAAWLIWRSPEQSVLVAATPRPPDEIVVSNESLASSDVEDVLWSNDGFVDMLRDEHLRWEEISPDALRSYYVNYYLNQVLNGGFSQFVYNSDWDPRVVRAVREGLRAVGAKKHVAVFEEGAGILDKWGEEKLRRYLAGEYFGTNAERDRLNQMDDQIMAADQAENLVQRNVNWLRQHPGLRPLPREQLAVEARRRGEALPDRTRRIADALAAEPRYKKLIRTLCERSGQVLNRITAGSYESYQGQRVMDWHFLTNSGHHHMIEVGSKVIMFRGHGWADRVCEIDAPPP